MFPRRRAFQAERTVNTKAGSRSLIGKKLVGLEQSDEGEEIVREETEVIWGVRSCRVSKAMVVILVLNEKLLKGFEQEWRELDLN